MFYNVYFAGNLSDDGLQTYGGRGNAGGEDERDIQQDGYERRRCPVERRVHSRLSWWRTALQTARILQRRRRHRRRNVTDTWLRVTFDQWQPYNLQKWVSLYFPSLLPSPRPLQIQLRALWSAVSSLSEFERSPTAKRLLHGAFWAENHAFGDTKSTINHLFVSQLQLWIIDIVRK